MAGESVDVVQEPGSKELEGDVAVVTEGKRWAIPLAAQFSSTYYILLLKGKQHNKNNNYKKEKNQ